jgi:hypothetical protein
MTTMNQIKLAIKPYMTAAIIIVLGIAVYEGLSFYKKHLDKRGIQLQQENAVLKSKVAEVTKNYNDLSVTKKAVEADNVKLDADAQYWKKKAQSIPRPPEPPKPPQDDATLVADLKLAGVEFRPLTDKNYLTDRTNLPTIWTWNKDSLRVPGLEEKLFATETSAAKFETETLGLKKELGVANNMLSEADKRELLRKEQEKNLNEQISNEHKKVVAAEMKGYIKIGAALVTGYFVGKAVRK